MTPGLTTAQTIIQACLFLIGAIAVFGGILQMGLGRPEGGAREDNVHRAMAGAYLGSGLISLWAGATIWRQEELPLLIALGVFLAGAGRLISIGRHGLPKPRGLWIAYLAPEILLPLVIAAAWWTGRGA